MAFHENHLRSVIKTLTYRALILFTNSVIVYAITQRLDITVGFVVVSNIVSTLLYFFHERAWDQIHWGKSHLKAR